MQNDEIAVRITELDIRTISEIYTREFLEDILRRISIDNPIQAQERAKVAEILSFYKVGDQ